MASNLSSKSSRVKHCWVWIGLMPLVVVKATFPIYMGKLFLAVLWDQEQRVASLEKYSR